MREILFRGKAANRIDGRAYRTNYKNGDWVYGLLTDAENYAGFSEMTNINGVSGIEVDKNTVGQFTGLTDKNGKKIFEGDILEYRSFTKTGTEVVDRAIVFWDEHRWCYERIYSNRWTPSWNCKGYKCDVYREVVAKYGEVIGNLHDNPELLGGAQDG